MPLDNWTDAIHTYEPDKEGRCGGGWTNSRGEWIVCGSRQRSSTLHDDPESDFRQAHDHGGGDCMCFEDEERYPDGYYGAMKAYVEASGR